LIGRTLEIALNSDDANAAIKGLTLALSRLAPAPRQESEKVVIQGFSEAKTFTARCECVMRAVGSGEITVESGDRLLKIIDTYMRSQKADNHEARLQAIESGRMDVVYGVTDELL
jgi:hypothetical protein